MGRRKTGELSLRVGELERRAGQRTEMYASVAAIWWAGSSELEDPRPEFVATDRYIVNRVFAPNSLGVMFVERPASGPEDLGHVYEGAPGDVSTFRVGEVVNVEGNHLTWVTADGIDG